MSDKDIVNHMTTAKYVHMLEKKIGGHPPDERTTSYLAGILRDALADAADVGEETPKVHCKDEQLHDPLHVIIIEYNGTRYNLILLTTLEKKVTWE